MICAKCAQPVAAGAQCCPACGNDPLLEGRYRLDQLLARDTLGASYAATRRADGVGVRARSETLHERPGQLDHPSLLLAAQTLDHRGLPRLLDELVIASANQRWLIHAHDHGAQTLAERLAASPRRTLGAPRVLALLHELAGILAYLEDQSPAALTVVLTPATILLPAELEAEPIEAEPRARLLEFADASVAGAGERLAYAAPEQRTAGRASAATRVWALAAVAVIALTGANLGSLSKLLAQRRWRDRVSIEERFAAVLERMLEHDPSRRISASAIQAALAPLLEDAAQARAEQPPSKPAPGCSSSLHHPWTQPSAQPREHRHANLATRAKPIAPRSAPSKPGKPGKRRSSQDVPLMRPEELSRELSQAHRATVALEHQQRSHAAVARVLVVLVVAVIAGLATYLGLVLGQG